LGLVGGGVARADQLAEPGPVRTPRPHASPATHDLVTPSARRKVHVGQKHRPPGAKAWRSDEAHEVRRRNEWLGLRPWERAGAPLEQNQALDSLGWSDEPSGQLGSHRRNKQDSCIEISSRTTWRTGPGCGSLSKKSARRRIGHARRGASAKATAAVVGHAVSVAPGDIANAMAPGLCTPATFSVSPGASVHAFTDEHRPISGAGTV